MCTRRAKTNAANYRDAEAEKVTAKKVSSNAKHKLEEAAGKINGLQEECDKWAAMVEKEKSLRLHFQRDATKLKRQVRTLTLAVILTVTQTTGISSSTGARGPTTSTHEVKEAG